MTPTVRQMLQGKPVVHAVRPGDTVYVALRLMADKNIGAVLVRSGDQIEGILSERDYARKVILLGKTSKETLVSEIMTTEVISASTRQVAEGAKSCSSLLALARQTGVDAPIAEHVDAVVAGRLTAKEMMEAFIARDTKAETD